MAGADGAGPNGVTIGKAPVGSGAVLYGTIGLGGNEFACGRGGLGCGTAYTLTPPSTAAGSWQETIIAGFPYSHGYYPSATLVIGPGGALFGATVGTLAKEASVFMLIPPSSTGAGWKREVLANFSATSVATPSSLSFSGGNLYGATSDGGDENRGTLWEIFGVL